MRMKGFVCLILAVIVIFPLNLAFGQDIDEPTQFKPDSSKIDLSNIEQPQKLGTPTTPMIPGDDKVEEMRRKIVKSAEAEVGLVYQAAGDDGFKKGWQRLKEYYEVAYKVGDLEKSRPSWLKSIKSPNGKVNEWCGIFGTYNWRKSGMPVHWDTRVVGCKYRGDKKNMKHGDIAILKLSVNPNNHHCVVKSINGNDLVAINGNASAQQVTISNIKVGDIEIFYSVADGLGQPLPPGGNVAGGGGKTGGNPGGTTGVKPGGTAGENPGGLFGNDRTNDLPTGGGTTGGTIGGNTGTGLTGNQLIDTVIDYLKKLFS